VHPLSELAPRDVVSRAIWRRLRDGDRIYLDAREAPGSAFAERFPAVFALCAARGLDPRRDLLPVTPAAHYLMGGVAVDLYGRTSLPGLYACGEVACTRVHGANRLASNSLLESVVFADRAAHDILAGGPPAAWPAFGAAGRRDTPGGGALQPHPTGAATGRSDPSLPAAAAADPAGTIAEVRRLMWEDVGLERTRTGLERALGRLDGLGREPAAGTVDAVNVVTVARLVAEAALARPHSLGSHYRADDPGTGGRAAG
jgi:aspartate oxidase